MTDTTNTTVNITIDGRAALIKHIEELQSIITRKNELIKALEEENQSLIQDPYGFIQRIKDQAYREGRASFAKYVKEQLESTTAMIDRVEEQ